MSNVASLLERAALVALLSLLGAAGLRAQPAPIIPCEVLGVVDTDGFSSSTISVGGDAPSLGPSTFRGRDLRVLIRALAGASDGGGVHSDADATLNELCPDRVGTCGVLHRVASGDSDPDFDRPSPRELARMVTEVAERDVVWMEPHDWRFGLGVGYTRSSLVGPLSDVDVDVFRTDVHVNFAPEESNALETKLRTLTVSVPYIDADGTIAAMPFSSSGFGDVGVAASFEVGSNTGIDDGPLNTDVQVGVTVPTGDEDEGLGFGEPTLYAGLRWRWLWSEDRFVLSAGYLQHFEDTELSELRLELSYEHVWSRVSARLAANWGYWVDAPEGARDEDEGSVRAEIGIHLDGAGRHQIVLGASTEVIERTLDREHAWTIGYRGIY